MPLVHLISAPKYIAMNGWKLLLLLLPSFALGDLVIGGITGFDLQCYPKTKPVRNPLSYATQNKNIDVLLYDPGTVTYYKHKFSNRLDDYFIGVPVKQTSGIMQIGLADGIKAVRLTVMPVSPNHPGIGEAVQIRFRQYMWEHLCSRWCEYKDPLNVAACVRYKLYCSDPGKEDPKRVSYSRKKGLYGNYLLNVNLRCFATLGMIPAQERDLSLTSCFRLEQPNEDNINVENNSRDYAKLVNQATELNTVSFEKYSDILNCEQGTDLEKKYPTKEEEMSVLQSLVLMFYKDALRLIPVVGPVLAKGAEIVEQVIENREKLDEVLKLVKQEVQNKDEYEEIARNFKKDLKKSLPFLARKRHKRALNNTESAAEQDFDWIVGDMLGDEDPFLNPAIDNGMPSPHDIEDSMLEAKLPYKDLVDSNIFNSFLT
ncbi:hypothetical protein EC973_002881 [Apophysomyces ossiformis]|uniref:Uncharacterized protein n=1 Tax=Apophysomyces ossiformis TaxID=679940 RepID=A0A8H7END3_9FUNG|nr:hypothetical protein EC973_002881 [Apophysomyces ossiformis]